MVSKERRAYLAAKYLLEDPKRLDEDGECIADVIVEKLVEVASKECEHSSVDPKSFDELFHRLAKDGYSVRDGGLLKTLPEAMDLAEADDEVHVLLDRHNFSIPKGHLDQAIFRFVFF